MLKRYLFRPVVAIKRCYENLRRSHLEHQDEKAEFAEGQAKRRKYRSRRERVLKWKCITCSGISVIILYRNFSAVRLW